MQIRSIREYIYVVNQNFLAQNEIWGGGGGQKNGPGLRT